MDEFEIKQMVVIFETAVCQNNSAALNEFDRLLSILTNGEKGGEWIDAS